MMKAWTITSTPASGKLGDEMQLVEDKEIPVPGPGEIVIQTTCAAVAIDDIRIAEDRFMPLVQANPSTKTPFCPGHECAGIVHAVGEGVTTTAALLFAVGDAVYGTAKHGAWAEYCVLDAKVTGKIPSGWTDQKAVAYITGAAVGGAAVQNLDSHGDDLTAKTAVVVGASGSIGSAVLQWLVVEKKMSKVWGVCSAGKAKTVLDLGATGILDYTKGPWEDQLDKETKVDYVFDFVGGTPVERAAKKVLKKEKDSIFITAIGPNDDTSKGVSWGGLIGLGVKMLWRGKTWSKPKWVMAVQENPSDNSGEPKLGLNIEPLIDRCVDGWDKAAVKEAIQRVDSRRAAGRVLLKMK